MKRGAIALIGNIKKEPDASWGPIRAGTEYTHPTYVIYLICATPIAVFCCRYAAAVVVLLSPCL